MRKTIITLMLLASATVWATEPSYESNYMSPKAAASAVAAVTTQQKTTISNGSVIMKPIRKNALWNCKNPYQGTFKKILCLCSAGLLRSPTIAWVLETKSDYNCRAAGIHDYALIQCDEVLIKWADTIICADEDIYNNIINNYKLTQPIVNLNIPDIYEYRQPELVNIIIQKLQKVELI